MQSIFWGLAVEISRALLSSLENVKISLPGTVLKFSVAYMLYIFVYGRNVEYLNEVLFLSLKPKKKILPQKELDYM